MSLNEESLIFLLENKETKGIIYQFDAKIIGFQKEMLNKEDVSFYYTFKDVANEAEEKIAVAGFSLGTKSETIFKVKLEDKILYECDLDVQLNEEVVIEWEMPLYLIFEDVAKVVLAKITEEHKNYIFSNKKK